MPRALSPQDADVFIVANRSLQIVGTNRTLQSYLDTHQPAYGVIVSPTPGASILVWYDASNRLHVIDVSKEPTAAAIAAPEYHTKDESFLYNVADTLTRGAGVVPDFGDLMDKITKVAIVAGVVYLGALILPMLKKRS